MNTTAERIIQIVTPLSDVVELLVLGCPADDANLYAQTLRNSGMAIHLSTANTQDALQASLRSRERFWDIQVPKIDSIFDNSLVPRPSWSPGVPPQHRKLVAATHRLPI